MKAASVGRSVSRDLPQLSIALTTGPPRVRNHVVWVGVWLLALSLGTAAVRSDLLAYPFL